MIGLHSAQDHVASTCLKAHSLLLKRSFVIIVVFSNGPTKQLVPIKEPLGRFVECVKTITAAEGS